MKFAVAQADESIEIQDEAQRWIDEDSNNMWSSCNSIARSAVAEYIANQRGLTLYPSRNE